MKRRVILLCVLMLVFLLGLWTGQTYVAQGQPPPKTHIGGVLPASKVGKYQITGVGAGLYCCDTETGLVWMRANEFWQPVIQRKLP